MAISEKTLQLANFNITFGEDDEPFLIHLEDFVFPAMRSGIIKQTKASRFYFEDVLIKKVGAGYVLTGMFVKDTTYQVRTVVKDNRLVEHPVSIPTAPYSRFIVFLESHRMVLIKNEGASPTARNFQTTLVHILKHYRQKHNELVRRKGVGSPLPHPAVSIVVMPLLSDLRATLLSLDKIKALRFSFFKLNNDCDSSDLAHVIRSAMGDVHSKTSNTQFNSPQSVEGTALLVEECTKNGLASATIKGAKEDGSIVTIRDNEYNSSLSVPVEGNVSEKDDGAIVDFVNHENLISAPSKENSQLYANKLEIIVRLGREG